MLKKLGQKLKNQKGLTLIELLAVIVILGIIAAIAVPSIGGIIQKSKEDAVKSDAIQVINAAKMYVAANGTDKLTNNKIQISDMEEFLDNLAITGPNKAKLTKLEVEYSDGEYRISTSAVQAGKETITFTDATVKDINDDDNKGTREIKGTK